MLREDIRGLLKATSHDLRKFGLMVGGVFLGLGLLFFLRHKPWWPWFAWPGAPLVFFGATYPRALKWIYVAWMTLAMLMGAVVSAMLMSMLFYLVMTPVGVIARIAGKDFLSLKLKSGAQSYWLKRATGERKPRIAHERQF